MKVLAIDNYDSFTYNLVQYLGELGADLHVVRNDRATVDELLEQGFDRVVVSPGPCTPREAGISVEVMRRFPEAGVPTLGVCLGHQSLAQAFGGRVIRHVPVHGKTTTIEHDGRTIFRDVPAPLVVGRYHSLVVEERTLPPVFEITARGGGVVADDFQVRPQLAEVLDEVVRERVVVVDHQDAHHDHSGWRTASSIARTTPRALARDSSYS